MKTRSPASPLRAFATVCAAILLSPASEAAPTFSVPGFVDETLYQGNGMISTRFDNAGRLWVTEKRGRVLVFEPNPGGASSYNYDYYETGVLSALPNFSTLTPVKSGVVNSFTLDPRTRDDDFAFRYSGNINIPTTGQYTFFLSSDDGSRLFIDNALVVNYDGTHGAGEMSGNVTLTAGTHNIRVEYFERNGGQSLTVQYSGPGIPKGPVAQGVFKSPKVFADLSAQVNTDGERGMTGMTLDPDFQNNRYVYVLFATGSDQRILRLTADNTFTTMVPGSELTLISGFPNTNTVHKAGDIAFHPNDPNNLYVMLGDDGNRYIVGDMSIYNGKILKISASDGKGLPDNPFYNGDVNSVQSRIWSYRYRNPYRFTFDPAAPINDVLYISENGDGTDRIARIAKGADGGWDNAFTTNSADGKRKILNTSVPSKTGIAIMRSGPFAPSGAPVLYNASYQGSNRGVQRWELTGANLDTLTPLAADAGAAFYNGYTDRDFVSFTPGPDGALYYTDSGQGSSQSTTMRLGRFRFVGGTAPVADFTASPVSGQSPQLVTFTDNSTAPGSTLASWSWNFGDGGTSNLQNPTHTYTEPGVYTVSLVVTNAQGLNDQKQSTVTVYHGTHLNLSGPILDGRTLPATSLGTPVELRLYQADGVTPLPFAGGTGPSNNAALSGSGVFLLAVDVQLTGPGVVISAGEAEGDGLQAAHVGISLSTSSSSHTASVTFRLSDTMLRGRVVDTKGAVAQVDLGLSRTDPGTWQPFAGGRDFLPGTGNPETGIPHRVVPDALGYYHIPLPAGSGGATFHLDTSSDTLSNSHGKVTESMMIATGTEVIRNLTIGLYNGGTGEANLSGIAVTPGVNYSTQIQTLFSNYCVACHNDIATNSGGLDLQSGASLGELVGHESAEAPGVKLVDPGRPERSYLMEKINATLPQVGTSMRPGDPMALAQRALIRDWITQLDPSGKLEFSSPVYTVAEGTTDTTATIGVRRTGGISTAVGVTVSTVTGGTATEDEDYTAVSATLSWTAGDESVKTFTIPILADALTEEDETVNLSLSSPTGGATLGTRSTATLVISQGQPAQPFAAWQVASFGEDANTPEAAPMADYDGDGLTNLIEYATGTNPVTRQASGVTIQPNEANKLALTFTPNPDATDILLVVEAGSDLVPGSWETLASKSGVAAWVIQPGVTVMEGTTEGSVIVTDSETISESSRRFLRLRVRLPAE